MKKTLIPLIAIVASAINIMAEETPAKDILVLKNNIKIDCLVQEVSNSQIKYYKLDLPNGPIFIEETSNIDSIMYRDGSVQTYENNTKYETKKETRIAAKQQKTNKQTDTQLPTSAFQCNFEVGAQFTSNKMFIVNGNYKFPSGGADFDMSFGARITKLAFIGAGVGIHSEFANPTITLWVAEDYKPNGTVPSHKGLVNMLRKEFPSNITLVTLPIYLDVCVYVPNKSIVTPYFLAHLGGYLPIVNKGEINEIKDMGYTYNFMENYHKGGFYMQLGFGFEVKRFQMSMGYRMHTMDDALGHYGFIKLGVRLGREVAPYKKL
ncbi:MAG: hypothetical protein KBT27_16040 [Prevotellaceae bacterium]|nr:hypothetical protein [Candidatus Faecinaster equi]